MRNHTIIFYSNDETRKKYFFGQYKTLVKKTRYICISLEGNVVTDPTTGNEDNCSIFKDFNELRFRLLSFKTSLSNVTIVVDVVCIDESSNETLRSLIIEYPDVKFVFWRNCEQCDLYLRQELEFMKKLFPITPDVLDYCSNENDNTLNNIVDTIEDLYASKDVESKIEDFYQELTGGKPRGGGCLPEAMLFLSKQWELFLKSYHNNKIEDFILIYYSNIIKYLSKKAVYSDLLLFPREIPELAISSLMLGYDNLFDASNLRYACKQWHYVELHVRRRNFKRQQECRKGHLAICVEEERGQNCHNSYCLFANGFRVLPVSSASELLYLNTGKLKPDYICRDYDLQFPDQPEDKINGMHPIYAIRGYDSEGNEVDNSPYWNHFKEMNTPIYFISKGNPGRVNIISPQKYSKHIKRKGKELFLPGILKPVNGIHKPFKCIKEVYALFQNTFLESFPLINTERMNHEHGVPLDIYEVVLSILDRARYYYHQKEYVHSAILGYEAMEIMNGFHQSLMLAAYHLYATSENAISMTIIGVSESELKQDTEIRVNKIAKDIGWLLKNRKDNGGKEQSINVLNQIYSDCRIFCREKEHFESESVFIGAMARLNEGCFLTKYIRL